MPISTTSTRRPAPRDLVGGRDRRLPVILPRRLLAPLLALDVGGQGPDPLHRGLPLIGADDGDGAGRVAGPIQRDGLVELLDLPRGQRRQCLEAAGLLRIGGERPAQIRERRRQRRLGCGVRAQVARLAGEEEASLAGLGVAQRGHHRGDAVDGGLGLAHAPGRFLTRIEGSIREQRDQRDRDRGGEEPGQRAEGQGAVGEEKESGSQEWAAVDRQAILRAGANAAEENVGVGAAADAAAGECTESLHRPPTVVTARMQQAGSGGVWRRARPGAAAWSGSRPCPRA